MLYIYISSAWCYIFERVGYVMHDAEYIYSIWSTKYHFSYGYFSSVHNQHLGIPLGKCTWVFEHPRNFYIDNAYITLFYLYSFSNSQVCQSRKSRRTNCDADSEIRAALFLFRSQDVADSGGRHPDSCRPYCDASRDDLLFDLTATEG